MIIRLRPSRDVVVRLSFIWLEGVIAGDVGVYVVGRSSRNHHHIIGR